MVYIFIGVLVGLLFGAGFTALGARRVLTIQAEAHHEEIRAWRTLAKETEAQSEQLIGLVERIKERRPANRLLGLGSGATGDDIRRAFRAMVVRAHPDRGGDPEVFRLLVRVRDEALRELPDEARGEA